MPKLTNKDHLDKLAKALDARAKALIKASVAEESARAQEVETTLQGQIADTLDMFGGKAIRYITQAQYNQLSDEEKNDPTIAYFITDAEDLSHSHSNKNLLDSFGARTLTIGSKGKTFDGSANVSWTLSEIGAAEKSHTHDDRYYTESEINTKVTELKAEIDADVKVETDRAIAAENALQAAIDGKSGSSHLHDDRYFTETEVTNKLSALQETLQGNIDTEVTRAKAVEQGLQTAVDGKAASGHLHDDRYYTESEMNTKLSTLKSDLQKEIDSDVLVETNRAKAEEQALQSAIDGKSPLGHAHDDRYLTEEEIEDLADDLRLAIEAAVDTEEERAMAAEQGLQAKIDQKSPIGHNHNDVYYTESEIDDQMGDILDEITEEADRAKAAEQALQSAINSKSDSGHLHDDRYYVKSTIDSKVTALQSEIDADVKVEADRAKAAEATLQANIDKKSNEGHNHDGRYYTETEIDGKIEALQEEIADAVETEADRAKAAETTLQANIDKKANSGHTHDDRYYTETEINTKISNLQSEIDSDVLVETNRAKAAETTLQANIDKKANASHGNHVPETETANNAKFLRNDNTWQTVTPANIGAAPSSHSHDDKYYTETEIDAKVTTLNNAINGKANSSHGNHVPTTETANNARFLRNDNTWQTVTPANIGAAASSHGTHVTYSTATPKANGTAATGSSGDVARADHVHPLQTEISGNAGSADKLSAPRTLTIGNTGKEFDGSANVSWTLTEIGASASGHTHDDRYYTESEINTKITNLQAEIDSDVKVEADRAKAAENTLQANIDKKANTSHGNHVPTTQTAANNVFLRNDNTWATVTPANIGASAEGHTHDGRYYTETEIDAKVTTINSSIATAKSDAQKYADTKIAALVDSAPEAMNTLNELATAISNHQGIYDAYVAEIDAKLAQKSDKTHTHNYAGSSSAGGAATSANKVNSSLKVQLNSGTTEGTNQFTFDGSAAKTINITPDNIGAAKSSHGTHVTYASATPSANGTAAVGSSSKVAREDHVHPLQTSVSGNAGSADKLSTGRTITIGNKSNTFDGTANISYSLSEIGASESGHTHNYAGSSSAGGAATSANKVNQNLAIKLNGGTTEGSNLFTFNGSAAKSINITPSSIGAAASSHGTHVGDVYATATPKANGTAAVGTSSKIAREDHVHPLQTTISGNAATSSKWANPITMTIGNKGKTVDGSANVSWTLTEIGAAATSHDHTHINRTHTTAPIYNPSSGVLVDFNLNVKSGVMAIVKIYGNSYSTNPPIEAIYQFYDYASGTIQQCTGSAISGPPITLKVYNVDGKLKAWFQQPNSYCTFTVEVRYGNNSSVPNVTLTNAAEPTENITQTVTITPNRVYSAAYKPSLTDLGAASSSHGTHVTYETATPKAPGTASVGTSTSVSRGDHVHPLQTTVSGNAGSATKLETARNINGTAFDGTQNITTANWGTSRNISISDSDGTNTGTAVSVNGSGNVTLKLPGTIKASLSGNSSSATKLASARTINGTSFDGSGNITTSSWGTARNISISDSDGTNTGTAVSVNGSGNATLKLPATIKATLSGNASSATKLATARSINGTNFDGSGAITTANWGTARNIQIGLTSKSVNGSAGVSWSLAEIGAEPAQPTVVAKTVSSGTLTLTKDKYQSATLATGNTIALPSVTDFTEINLFVKDCNIANVNLPDNCKWRVDPNLNAGTSFIFTFIYTGQEWLAEVKIYS